MVSIEEPARITRAERRAHSQALQPPPGVDQQRWWAGIQNAASAARDKRGRFVPKKQTGGEPNDRLEG